MVEQKGHRTPLVRGKPEEEKEEQGSPEGQRTLNACSNQGGGGGTLQLDLTAGRQGMDGDTSTRLCSPPASIQGKKEWIAPPSRNVRFPCTT